MTEGNDRGEPMDRISHDPAMSTGLVRGWNPPRRQILLGGLVGLVAAGTGLAYWLGSRPAPPPSRPRPKATPLPQPTLLHTYQGLAQAGAAFGIAWSDGDRRLASVCEGGIVQVWNVGSQDLHFTSREQAETGWVAWSADGRRLAGAGKGGGRIWDVADHTTVALVWREQGVSTREGSAFRAKPRGIAVLPQPAPTGRSSGAA